MYFQRLGRSLPPCITIVVSFNTSSLYRFPCRTVLECGTLITSVERVGMLFRFVQPLVAEPAGQVQAEDLDDEVSPGCMNIEQGPELWVDTVLLKAI